MQRHLRSDFAIIEGLYREGEGKGEGERGGGQAGQTWRMRKWTMEVKSLLMGLASILGERG